MAIGEWHEVSDLAPGYRHARRILEKVRESADKGDKETIGGMISDCDYVLEWIHTGRRPGSMKGAELPYKVRTWDPVWLESYRSPNGWSVHRESRDLTDDERFRIEEAMRDLSPREKQCYMLYHCDGMSEYDIARELNVGRSTVHEFLDRANKKISDAKTNSLFLLE